MMQFSTINGVLRKLPPPVVAAIVQNLQQIGTNSTHIERRAAANLNLALAYVNGIGVTSDLKEASRLALESSLSGNSRGKSMFATALVSINNFGVLPDVCDRWLEQVASDGDHVALRKLREISEDRWTAALQLWISKELEEIADEPDDAGATSIWRPVFRNDMIEDSTESVKGLLEQDPSGINNEVLGGETALQLACRFGKAKMTMLLLEHGASASVRDRHGVTPLHWLISFPPRDKLSIAESLKAHGADLHAVSNSFQALGSSPRNLFLDGHPLHWAISEGDVAAAEALLTVGADPLSRPPQTNDHVYISAFELVCQQCNVPILKRLLQSESVRKIVDEPRPLTPSTPVMVRPLFYVVCDRPRWDRLIYHGVDFEQETKETIKLLTQHGATYDAVLQANDAKMTAAFALAYHQCSWDIMKSGFSFGFKDHINSTFGHISSGGTPLFLAITHKDRDLVHLLLENGADVHAVDKFGMDPLQRAAKETDDVLFIESLLTAGCSLEPSNPNMPSGFYIAVHAGNFRVAKCLFDKGADRDRMVQSGSISKTILCDMLHRHRYNGARRVKFLLSLPDRNGSDGFIVMRDREHSFGAFHLAVPLVGENPDDAEISRLMVSMLLNKYADVGFVNSTQGPHRDTVIGMATEMGNYKIVKALLEKRADPNLPDEYGRTALDKMHWRYCYPHKTEAIKDLDPEDGNLIARTLRFVNANTSELMSLLTSYKAKPNVFRFPGWHAQDSGYRTAEWVTERLWESKSPEVVKKAAETMASTTPVWGGLPITVPERPMQLSRKETSGNAKTEEPRGEEIREQRQAPCEQTRDETSGNVGAGESAALEWKDKTDASVN
jgi:ankyrin repeat protein